MKIKVITAKTAKTMDASNTIFDVAINSNLISQAARRQLANRRNAIAHTKTRGEVSGGGKKPWKQKGTGRARAGSSRSPIWIGGGITFGPRKTRNFSQKLPQKMRQKAIYMALSEKNKNHKLIVVESLQFSKIATSAMQSFLEKLPIEEGKILIILDKTNVNVELSAANVPYTKVIQAQNINILDLLKFDYIVTDMAGVKAIQTIFGAKNE